MRHSFSLSADEVCGEMLVALERQLALCRTAAVDAVAVVPNAVVEVASGSDQQVRQEALTFGLVCADRSQLAVECWEAHPYLDSDAWEAWIDDLEQLGTVCGVGPACHLPDDWSLPQALPNTLPTLIGP